MKKGKPNAILTVIDAQKMTNKQKKCVADWLRHQAKEFTKDKYEYSKEFRARCFL